ncbi:MAG: DNA polymerase III subunit beta [Blastocatellales bacterium]
MHFTVSKSALLKELNLIQGVVEKKSTIPILSNLLLEAQDGELSIKGTDLDVSISTRCGIEIRKEGAICLQAKKLFEIVRALPEAEIEFKQGENEQITIVCERSRFRMAGLVKDNFPEVQEFDGPFTSFPAEMLRTFIARTSFAITAEESRYTLNGAKFEVRSDKARMVATDGHRLSYIEKAVALDDTTLDVLIPKKTLAEISRLSAESEETVEVGFNENHLFFRFGKRLLASRTLSGQFPNYEMVLPKGNDNRVAIPANQIAGALRRVSLMADERSHTIRLDVTSGKLTISAPASETGDATEVLPVEYEGPEISLAFNAQYLLDFFSVIQDGDVLVEFKDSNSQAQLRAKDESDYDFRYIVMPMRL